MSTGRILRESETSFFKQIPYLADLTVSKRPGTSHQIEIHFAVVNHLYLLFPFVTAFPFPFLLVTAFNKKNYK